VEMQMAEKTNQKAKIEENFLAKLSEGLK